MIIIGVLIGFIGLLTLSFWISYYILKKKKAQILFIDQNKVKDPRYFGKSFSKMMEQVGSDFTRGYVQLSEKEKISMVLENSFNEYDYKKIVVCKSRGITNIPKYINFSKEVYISNNAKILGENTLHSLYVNGELIIESNINVIRWIDAKGKIRVGDHCNLGISTTSEKELKVGCDCHFHRLYAPVMILGCEKGCIFSENEMIVNYLLSLKVERSNIKRNIKYITDDMVDKNGVIPFTIITARNLVITENVTIIGDIRSDKGVKLCEGSIVCGNVFSEDNIFIGKNVMVLGTIFTQGSVIIEDGAIVGRKGTIRSIIARESIIINGMVKIYGYISCEKGGIIKEEQRHGWCEIHDDFVEKVDITTKRPIEKGVYYLGAVVCVCIICLVSILSYNHMNIMDNDLEDKVVTSEQLYRNDGTELELETTPISVDNKFIIFKDRILQRFTANNHEIELDAKAYNSILNMVPEKVNKYVMLVPMRIQYESSMKEYAGNVDQGMNLFASKLLDNAKYIDIREEFPTDGEHYLFFRTEPYWTAEGAYYGANAFFKQQGKKLEPLEKYETHVYNGFKGSLVYKANQETYINKSLQDKLYFYTSKQFVNKEIICTRDINDQYIITTAPILSKTRNGLSAYVGGASFSHAILDSNVENGKTIVIFGDISASIMASYFTDEYENVYVINQTWYQEDNELFLKIFDDYNVTDFLMVQSASKLGDELNRSMIGKIIKNK